MLSCMSVTNWFPFCHFYFRDQFLKEKLCNATMKIKVDKNNLLTKQGEYFKGQEPSF